MCLDTLYFRCISDVVEVSVAIGREAEGGFLCIRIPVF
jgi:hypothetical protein